MAKNKTLQISSVVPTVLETVSAFFTNSQHLRDWLCDIALVENRPAGRVLLRWTNGEELLATWKFYQPGRQLVLESKVPGIGIYSGFDRLQVLFSPENEGRHTKVQLTFTQVDELEQLRTAWRAALEVLATVLQTGLDLRLRRRPILGVFLEPTPASDPIGLLVNDVTPTIGAGAAGILQGDVLTRLDNHELRSLEDYQSLLSSYHVGEQVPLTFLRGGKELTLPVAFAARREPEWLPDVPQLLAKVRQQHDDALWLIGEAVATITDSQALYSPAPDEWSVGQVIAHLILTEMDVCNWLTAALRGEEPNGLFSTSRDNTRIQSLVNGCGSLGALLIMLRLTYATTLGFVQVLPADKVTLPTFWRRVALLVPDDYGHTAGHIEQIRAAAQAAKAAGIL